MTPVYFDTSVFLAILAGQPEATKVKGLLAELKADKIRIYTSILTVQEASVSSFMHGNMFADPHTKIARMARIKGVTREIAMTAAKYEANVITLAKKATAKSEHEKIEDNRRRKFDCFHLATAVAIGCSNFYAFDKKYDGRCKDLGIAIRVLEPEPKKPTLPFPTGPIGIAPGPAGL
jgi:predicted nucleic acid-binding protein